MEMENTNVSVLTTDANKQDISRERKEECETLLEEFTDESISNSKPTIETLLADNIEAIFRDNQEYGVDIEDLRKALNRQVVYYKRQIEFYKRHCDRICEDRDKAEDHVRQLEAETATVVTLANTEYEMHQAINAIRATLKDCRRKVKDLRGSIPVPVEPEASNNPGSSNSLGQSLPNSRLNFFGVNHLVHELTQSVQTIIEVIPSANQRLQERDLEIGRLEDRIRRFRSSVTTEGIIKSTEEGANKDGYNKSKETEDTPTKQDLEEQNQQVPSGTDPASVLQTEYAKVGEDNTKLEAQNATLQTNNDTLQTLNTALKSELVKRVSHIFELEKALRAELDDTQENSLSNKDEDSAKLDEKNATVNSMKEEVDKACTRATRYVKEIGELKKRYADRVKLLEKDLADCLARHVRNPPGSGTPLPPPLPEPQRPNLQPQMNAAAAGQPETPGPGELTTPLPPPLEPPAVRRPLKRPVPPQRSQSKKVPTNPKKRKSNQLDRLLNDARAFRAWPTDTTRLSRPGF